MDNLCKDTDRTQWTGGCDWELGVPDHIIITPRDIKITESDAENLINFLRTKAEVVDPGLAFYPVYGEIKRITDESTEPTVGTLDKGFSKQLLSGREVLLLEWPSGVNSDRHIQKLNRYSGGCLIINSQKLLIGSTNRDGSMGALPVEVSTFGGGFSGSGGDVQTMRMRIDLGAEDKLVQSVMAYRFAETDRIENIFPAPPTAP